MPREYRLTDVLNETGATFARIQYWRSQGLLPRVPPRGRYTTYTQEYVDRVKQIMTIYDHNMTCADIRDYFSPEPDE